MVIKQVTSLLDKAVEEFNKDKIPSAKITKADANAITRLQFKVLKEYINRPFYSAMTFNGLFTMEVRISYIRSMLHSLIDIMKRARGKGLEGEKEYYEAAKSFGYWRILYQKSFIFVKEKNKSSHLKWKENAKIKNAEYTKNKAENKPVRKMKISKIR